jgi:uncharacterized protein
VNALIKQLTVPFLVVLLTIGLLYLFSTLFGPIPFSVKSTVTTNTDLFTVSGVGEESAVPDTAQFTTGVTKTGPTVEAAKDQVNQATNAIIAQFKSLGIEETDIKTQNFNTFPNQDFNRGNTVTGYTVSQELSVTAKSVDIANKALDAATAQGANQITGVTFTINDDDKKALEQKARKKAIEDAKAKAADIAKDAGIRLGKVVNISVSDQGQPPVMFDARMQSAGKVENSAPTQLQPGENKVSVTVTLSYETL